MINEPISIVNTSSHIHYENLPIFYIEIIPTPLLFDYLYPFIKSQFVNIFALLSFLKCN